MVKFRPMARIISHLGERLISSSKVALLELIKNSYDAKSSFVEITIDQKNNQMIIYDEGHGMNKNTLENYWLVVGTSHRLNDKSDLNPESDEVPLGEKGLGRFATMKLGNFLKVETTTETENRVWNLEIDWEKYGYRSNYYLDEVENKLYSTQKNDVSASYTKITISSLKDFVNDQWTEADIDNFVGETAFKFINPFKELPRGFVIKLIFIDKYGKKTPKVVGNAEAKLLEQAHHEIYGEYTPGELKYGYYIRRDGKIIEEVHNQKHLIDSNFDSNDNSSEGYVGAFKFHFFVFNRSRLGEINEFESIHRIRELLNRYTGGPMIFRDGFRIYPYGDPGDDWLQLNKEKFRMGKVKIVGEQTTGYISLNSIRSPFLVDQTNREGLVKNKSYDNFHDVIKDIFNILVNIVVRNEPKETSTQITSTARKSADNIEKTVLNIKKNGNITEIQYKQIIKESKLIKKGILEIKKREKALVETSAVGMTSMQIAHEIHNFINKLYSNLDELKKEIDDQSKTKVLMLEMNLKSLRTLISQIDEQAATLRRAKSNTNLVSQLKDIINTMQPVTHSYEKYPITISLSTEINEMMVKVNKGLIIQLLDNLMINSMYWINSLGTSDNSDEGKIVLNLDSNGILTIYDNGPGIAPIDSKAIFEPFFSRKKGGRGLGLFISKEISAFHGITLELLPIENQRKRYYCYRIDFSKVRS
ncbi:hypothetical protein J28TS4_47590 [Paenibacillus lautus]|uniref:sensor histidine kinase n=1 Tax=Paenibacillus lautus TaxID=1401 RepID=UPI001B09C1AC|nr:sensor histidine kinase [Paenibacillus lautus]GIP06352.1 hypothetical protein J28TS4_47590 [Paenibacillus lautus]